MKRTAYIILAGAIFTITVLWYYILHPMVPTLTMKGTVYTLELAVTNAEKTRGLSGRLSLKPGHGMLFLYDHKERFPFTMRGMQFPLDFVWLDGNVVMDITKNVAPETPIVAPHVAIDKVLEINAGDVDALNLKIGDAVVFNK